MIFRIQFSRTLLLASTIAVTTAYLVGCSKPSQPEASASAASEQEKPLDKITLTTTWFAQAEHGGFYQAQATGIYKKYGLDVTVNQGGPQVNGISLLLAKNSDIVVSYDLQVLLGIEQGFPLKAIATSFQYDPQGILTHKDVNSFADLKGKTLLISSGGQMSWWPWLKEKYKLDDSQVRPYTFNLQPFLADPNAAQQAYATSEVFPAQAADPSNKFFLFAKDGYPAYGGLIVTRDDMVQNKPDVLKRFVQATAEGWKSYLEDPTPANKIIQQENPQMKDEQIEFSISQMKALEFITGGDAATQGIGVITEERWKATRDMMVDRGLLKADTDWKKAFTLQFSPPANPTVK